MLGKGAFGTVSATFNVANLCDLKSCRLRLSNHHDDINYSISIIIIIIIIIIFVWMCILVFVYI